MKYSKGFISAIAYSYLGFVICILLIDVPSRIVNGITLGIFFMALAQYIFSRYCCDFNKLNIVEILKKCSSANEVALELTTTKLDQILEEKKPESFLMKVSQLFFILGIICIIICSAIDISILNDI